MISFSSYISPSHRYKKHSLLPLYTMSANKRLKNAKGKPAEPPCTTPPSQDTGASGRSLPKLECNACGETMVSQRHLACHAKSFKNGSCVGRKAYVRMPRVEHTAETLQSAKAKYEAGSIGAKQVVRIQNPITIKALHQQDATRSLLAASSKTGVRLKTQLICMEHTCVGQYGNISGAELERKATMPSHVVGIFSMPLVLMHVLPETTITSPSSKQHFWSRT